MCLLIRSMKSPWYLVSWYLKYTLVKIAGKRTAQALDRATSERQAGDERDKKETEKCTLIKNEKTKQPNKSHY